MIQIRFCTGEGQAVAFPAPYFRLTAGVLWDHPSRGPLARYQSGVWIYQDHSYERIELGGSARLFFGILRDPSWISGTLNGLVLEAGTLHTARAVVAYYDERHEVWQSVEPPSRYWHAFRIVSAELLDELSDDVPEKWVATTLRHRAAPRRRFSD